MLTVNDVFVTFTITKLKYILTISLVEYSTFRTYMMFLLININALLQPKSSVEVMQSIFMLSHWECSIR